MKLNLTITFHSVIALVIFLGFPTLLSAANPAPSIIKLENKSIFTKQFKEIKEGGAEILHGEILFNY